MEQEEKLRIQNDLHILTERLARVTESLSQKMTARDEFDRTIKETELAYSKVGADAEPRSRAGLPGLARRAVWNPLHVHTAMTGGAAGMPWQILESSQTLLSVLKQEVEAPSPGV